MDSYISCYNSLKSMFGSCPRLNLNGQSTCGKGQNELDASEQVNVDLESGMGEDFLSTMTLTVMISYLTQRTKALSSKEE